MAEQNDKRHIVALALTAAENLLNHYESIQKPHQKEKETNNGIMVLEIVEIYFDF